MKFLRLLACTLVLGLSACAPVQEEPERFGTVKVVKVEEKIDEKTGQVQIIKKIVEEKAERSVVDKGSDALLTPQKVVSFNQFFNYFDIGKDNSILASVYNNEDGNASDLWIYKNSKMRLTNTNYDHLYPSFSSDGRYVYFASYKGKRNLSRFGQDSYIWRTSTTGSGGITRIGSPSYAFGHPIESPDSDLILFASVELYGNMPYIWYMARNGALPTQLKQGIEPQWLDKETIVFSAKDESTGLYTIWTCKIDGSVLTQIISDSKFNCISPHPSKNGKYIAYVKENPNPNDNESNDPKVSDKVKDTRDIYIYHTNDGLSQQVTTNQSRDDIPKWSPDNKYLYFRSSRGLGWNIWRLETSFLNQ